MRSAMSLPRAAALIFGLNYAHWPPGRLAGCIHDAHAMATYLSTVFGSAMSISVFTDDVKQADTTKLGMVAALNRLAAASSALDYVWIHYSGHGAGIRDRSGDELDGQDECLVPSDYGTTGQLLTDDELVGILARFAPGCRVVLVLDSCHSGTAADLLWLWPTFGANGAPSRQNKRPKQPSARILALSGCQDSGTSADAVGLVPGSPDQPSGALTSCLLAALNAPHTPNNAFGIVQTTATLLQAAGFRQQPRLSSTYDLRVAPALLPVNVFSSGLPRVNVRGAYKLHHCFIPTDDRASAAECVPDTSDTGHAPPAKP